MRRRDALDSPAVAAFAAYGHDDTAQRLR